MPSESGELQRMAPKIDDLPLLPQVLVRILQIDASTDDYFEQVEVRAHHAKVTPTLKPGSVEAVTLIVQAADRLDIHVLGAEDRAQLTPEDVEQRIKASVLHCAGTKKHVPPGPIVSSRVPA